MNKYYVTTNNFLQCSAYPSQWCRDWCEFIGHEIDTYHVGFDHRNIWTFEEI